jgi:cysteine synthase
MTTPPTFDTAISTRLSGLSQIVGNTPLLEIPYEFRCKQRVIYAKSEQLNLTGSIKDRMALHILKEAYRSGQLHPGDTIAEATSGNTGISLAAIGRALGHPVKIFMPDWMSCERKDLIASYGADIVAVSHEQGGFLGSIHMAEEFSQPTRCVPALPVFQRGQRRSA